MYQLLLKIHIELKTRDSLRLGVFLVVVGFLGFGWFLGFYFFPKKALQ